MKQRTKSEWENLVREYRSSGKSLRAWCDENGINYKTMCGHTHLVPAQNEKRTEKEWIDLISKKQASGMTREGWCRENGVNPNSMLSAEKRINAKLDLGNTASAKQSPAIAQGEEAIEESKQINTSAPPHTDYAAPKWIEIGISEPPKPTLSLESSDFSNIRPSDSFDGEIIKDVKKSELLGSKIMIHCGKLTIEADADYPSEHLENLIGKLAAVC